MCVMIIVLIGTFNTVLGGNGAIKPRDVKVDFSTRASWIDGDCRRDRGLCLHIEITIDTDGNAPMGNFGNGEIKLLGDDKIQLNIFQDNGEEVDNNSVFNVYQDIQLSDEICERLGVRSCVIKKGQYKILFNEFEFGSVQLNVESN